MKTVKCEDRYGANELPGPHRPRAQRPVDHHHEARAAWEADLDEAYTHRYFDDEMHDRVKALPRDQFYAVTRAMGLFYDFVGEKQVRMVGVEAGGRSHKLGDHAARFSGGRPGVLHGTFSYILQDDAGQVVPIAGQQVSADVLLGKAFRFVPSTPWSVGQGLRVTIGQSARDHAGHTLASEVVRALTAAVTATVKGPGARPSDTCPLTPSMSGLATRARQ